MLHAVTALSTVKSLSCTSKAQICWEEVLSSTIKYGGSEAYKEYSASLMRTFVRGVEAHGSSYLRVDKLKRGVVSDRQTAFGDFAVIASLLRVMVAWLISERHS